jgi:hypothetical protein
MAPERAIELLQKGFMPPEYRRAIIAVIESQRQQIQAMRHCINCLFFSPDGIEDEHDCPCELEKAGKECHNFNLWEWDGGIDSYTQREDDNGAE